MAITAGSGTAIAADDISSVWYQRFKLVHGADGTNDGDVSNINPLPVSPRNPTFDSGLIQIPGLAAAAYAAADQFGTIVSVSNAARVAGAGGRIEKVIYHDADDVMGGIDLVLFESSVTLAADNAAYAVSDADGRAAVGMVNMTYLNDMGAQRLGIVEPGTPYVCAATTLYVAVIARVAATITSTTGHYVRFLLTRD